MWFDLLSNCSAESIYHRFGYVFRWNSHDVAARYCLNDYDREIAIVAETDTGACRRIVAVGRLISDPLHEEGEYAILVADDWQHRGLGSVITDYCIEIARNRRWKRIVAQTAADNRRMISLFRKRGFEMTADSSSPELEALKDLA